MIGFMVGLVVGGALGVCSTVVLGIVVHQRQQNREQDQATVQEAASDPTVLYRDAMLRRRELVDEDGNLRYH